MKTNLIKLCAVVLLAAQTVLLAQKTEISVKKGKVKATTESGSALIDAGRKAILTPDKHFTVTVDDLMVDDVMEIYKWVEAEKQAQRERIEGSGIQIFKIDDVQYIKCAWLSEGTNSDAEPLEEIRRGPTLILKDPKYYDMEGNLIPFELEKIDARSGIYTLHLSKPIQSGEQIKYIGVCEIDNAIFSKDGPLWIFRLNYGSSANSLVYYRFILPKSAIFVDSSQPATMIDSVDGRVAVTIRIYTGPTGDGVTIAYLWPDKDGTTVADIPPQYRGLRDKKEEEIVQAGRIEIAKIISGGTYEEQNTPLETLLSLYSAAVNKNSEHFLNLVSPGLRELATGQIDQIMGLASRVVDYGFLGTPNWPEEPENGYEHPVYLCRDGSLICEATIVMFFQDGKWYLKNLESGRKKMESEENTDSDSGKVAGGVKILKDKIDLGAVTYEGIVPGKFMRRWLFLGPIRILVRGDTLFPSEKTQKIYFDDDLLRLERFEPKVNIEETDYEWAMLQSDYGIVDLSQLFEDWYLIGYAWAQIEMTEETSGILGIGSDDSVKVWLNGQLVHEHWTTRGAVPDNDRVPVTFKKGTNHLVLKIQNRGGPWGFACRLLEK